MEESKQQHTSQVLGRSMTTPLDKGSDQASETSEQLIAQMREQFKKKEAKFTFLISQLNQKISGANEVNREKAQQYNLAFANNSEYGHLQQA